MKSLIFINDVFESLTQEKFTAPARVLWIAESYDEATLITIETPAKKPWTFSYRQLLLLVEVGEIKRVVITVPKFLLKLEEELEQKDMQIRDDNWARIKPLIETKQPGEIFFPKAMGALVAAQANFLAIDKKTLYRLLYRYWQFGSNQNSLLPNYLNSGGPGKPKKFVNGVINGRPPKYQGLVRDTRAPILTDADKAAIKIGYAMYKNNSVECITDAYIKTLNKFYRAERSVPGFSDDDFTLKPAHELPTPEQFDYWGKKAFDEITVLRGRKGERAWEKDHRELIGRANQGLFGPCHRFEIDSTIADVYLVSRFNRNWIIGRPVVYVIVDVFSRMIVGIYVGLEGPSWAGARQALWNAFSDKVTFCRRYGLHINPDDWPCHHLPQEIVADRAELLGDNAEENLVKGLSIDLGIPPPYRPDWKAIVESRFRLLNRTSKIKWAPGGVAARVKERGERDYRLDATLDMNEFTKIIIKSVLQYNRYSRQPDWLNNEMIAQNLDPTPISIWNWGVDQGFGRPNVQAPELVYLHLLPKARASIQAGGIYFEGRFFISASDDDGKKFARARAKGREPIDVWHDSTRPEHIWLRADGAFVQYNLRASESRYQGFRLEEIQDMLEMVKNPSPKIMYDELVSKVKLDEQIGSIVQHAIEDKATNKQDLSAAQQVADIRTNRATELAYERAARPAPVDSGHASTITHARGLKSPSSIESYGQRTGEVIDLLSRLRKK